MLWDNITLASPEMEKSKFSVELEKLRACFTAHEEPGRLVVLEGTPGSGKTTALALLASRNELLLLPELDHVTMLGASREVIESSLLERWYIKTELNRQLAIREELKSGKFIYQDRSVLGTIAFAYASSMMNNDHLGFIRFTELLLNEALNKLLLPDAMVILLVNQQISLQRRRKFRYRKQYSLWFNTEFLSHYETFYRSHVHHVVPIHLDVLDTSHDSPNMIAGFLKQTLTERGCFPPGSNKVFATSEH